MLSVVEAASSGSAIHLEGEKMLGLVRRFMLHET
jgi:hypothetical protein